jgi:acyl-CoA hydrolase
LSLGFFLVSGLTNLTSCNIHTPLISLVAGAVDSLEFKGPAYANDTVLLTAKVTYVGKTSMEVCVKSYVEELNGEKKLINVAYVVMVALDENERPVEVPGLILETEEERCDWEMGKKRYLLRKQRKSNAGC